MSLEYLYDYFNIYQCEKTQRSEAIKALTYLGMDNEKAHDLAEKFVNSKNSIGLLLLNFKLVELEKLLPDYLVGLMNINTSYFNDVELCNVFGDNDQQIWYNLNTIKFATDEKNIDLLRTYIKKYLQDNFIDKSDVFKCFEFGRKKYNEWDFLNLHPYSLLMAIARHMIKDKLKHQRNDDESGLSHAAHVATNMYMLYHIISQRKCNDESNI